MVIFPLALSYVRCYLTQHELLQKEAIEWRTEISGTARVVDVPEECWLKLRPVSRGGYVPARIFPLPPGISWRRSMAFPRRSMMSGHGGDRISEREWRDLIRDRSRAKPF